MQEEEKKGAAAEEEKKDDGFKTIPQIIDEQIASTSWLANMGKLTQ